MSKFLSSACHASVLMASLGISALALQSTAAQQLTVNKPSLKSGPTQLTAQETQAANSMTSAQVQAYVSKIQPALTKLKNDIATHQQSINMPSWQALISGGAQFPPASK